MFCTKCGYNAGTAKFCPKCGNPLNPQPVQEAPIQSESVAAQPVQDTPVQSEPVQQQAVQPQVNEAAQQSGTQQFGTQQQFGTVPPVNGEVPRYQEAPSMQLQPKKKKKKWPIVTAIIVVIIAVLAAAAVVFLPKIKDLISPDKHAVTAVKKLGTGLEETVNKALDNMALSSVSDKNEITGTLKIDTAVINDEKYSDYVKADTVTYDIQMDSSTEKMAGEIKLQNGTTTALTLTFYSDNNNIYFKVPELFSESFTISLAQLEDEMDLGYYGSVSDLSKYFSMIDTSNIDMYKEPINAAVKCVVKGINTFAEECQYKKGESLIYNSDNGDLKVSEYSMTITKDAVVKSCEKVIDEMYASKELSSYMTLLTMAGVSQTTIKSSIESSLADMPEIKLSMFINKDDEIVKLAMDVSDYDSDEVDFVAVSFLGNDNPFEYVVIEAEVEDMNMKYSVKEDNDKLAVTFDMSQNKQYVKAGIECSVSGTTVKIDNMYVNSNVEDGKIDMKLSGEASQKEFSKLKYSASDYSGAYNIANLTETQSTTLALELMKNSKVLSNVFSDKLYKELFYGMSTSGNARLGF